MRTNCIDSLDRTNAAQYMVGKTVLMQMLAGLGVGGTASVGGDGSTEADEPLHVGGEVGVGADILLDMYEALGNQIALQYGGSELANTMKSYAFPPLCPLCLLIIYSAQVHKTFSVFTVSGFI